MFGPLHYVPVLKWKQGEYFGLRDTREDVRDSMTPIIEFQDAGEKEWPRHIEDAVDRIAKIWGTKRCFFLDLYHIEEFVVNDEVTIAAETIYDQAETKGLSFIPVISPYSTEQEIHS